MKHMIKAKLIFDTKEDADEAYTALQLLVLKYKKMNTLTDREEYSYVRFIQCFHDQSPPSDCVVVKEFNNK